MSDPMWMLVENGAIRAYGNADLGEGWRPAPAAGQHGPGWVEQPDGSFAPPLLPVPAVLPKWQVRAELRARGLLPAVEAGLAALPEPVRTSALEWWEHGTEVHLASPLYQQLAQQLVPDAAERDAMWVSAAARALMG